MAGGENHIEITESTAIQNIEMTVRNLREMGVGIVIDDFGIGYSSLSYLKMFPVTALKIDRSFVRDMMTSRSDAAIVESMIATARALDLRLIAEGVETEQQLEFLKQQRCSEAQGYSFSKPLPPAQLHLFFGSA